MWKIWSICICLTYIHGQILYVDKNDASSFHTIEEAVDIARAGDTIVIKAGSYHERIYIEKSGTKLHPIIIKNYQHDKVIIDGTGLTWEDNWGGLLHLDGISFVHISGLTIQHSIAAGIYLNTTQHVTIENMKTYNTHSSGIGVWDSNHTLITHNDVKLACNDGEQECITVVNSHDVNVTYNEVHHSGPGTNGGEGIDIKQGSHHVAVKYNHVHDIRGSSRPGLYADAWDVHTHHIVFESNSVHDISGNAMSIASEMGGLLEHITFVNNIVYNNVDGGMIVGGWTADNRTVPSNPLAHINIVNNTFYNVGGDGIYIDNLDAKDMKIYNNIIQSPEKVELPIYVRDGVNYDELDIRKNLIDRTYPAYGQHSEIVGNPLFVDAANGDFHLQFDSPAIHAGIQHNFSLLDYDKNSRTNDGQWDIGAYENKVNIAFLIPVLYLLL